MSHFYASIQGNRSERTCQGTKLIDGHIRGWNLGIAVEGRIDKNGNDYFEVYRTSGSGGSKPSRLITTVRRI